jgi:hypothetical protein
MRELNNVGNPYEARKITVNHIGSALVALPFNIISRLRTGDPCGLSSSPSSSPFLKGCTMSLLLQERCILS